MIFTITIWSLWTIASSSALALPPEYQVNIREGCRQSIAGAYLHAHDEHERLQGYIVTIKEQLSSAKIAAAKADTEAKTAAVVLAKNTYDTDLASKNDAAASMARTMRAQVKDYQELLTQASQQLPAAEAAEKKLRQQILKVFNIERLPDPPKGGYPFRITYRSECPKYRALCPLPNKEREALLEIRVDGTLPESCQRYAEQSMLR
jgi:hypothetical protein